MESVCRWNKIVETITANLLDSPHTVQEEKYLASASNKILGPW
jgi:hypothetical protein